MWPLEFNYWGIISVPVGLAICFGPALFVWLRQEIHDQRTGYDPARSKTITAEFPKLPEKKKI